MIVGESPVPIFGDLVAYARADYFERPIILSPRERAFERLFAWVRAVACSSPEEDSARALLEERHDRLGVADAWIDLGGEG